MYVYPTPADRLPDLVALVGDFWTERYGGAGLVVDILRGVDQDQVQLFDDLLAVQDSIGRRACPIAHIDQVSRIVIKHSTGASGVYPWPADSTAYLIADDPVAANTLLVEGVHYTLNGDAITFLVDPFVDPAFNSYPVLEAGVEVDQAIDLWAIRLRRDLDWINTQFGFIVGIPSPSTEASRTATVALLDALSGGTTHGQVASFASACAGIPLCAGNETVEVSTVDQAGRLVITDASVYRFPATATPVVTVGQVLAKHAPLVDTLTVFESRGGSMPDLTSITLDAGHLDPTIAGPLTFGASPTALNVTLNVSGYTRVDWALGGAGGDVVQFFDRLHAKGIAAGKTLAMCLDTRPQPQSTQPTAAHLPTTIAPLAFLFANALRSGAYVIHVAGDLGAGALGLGQLDKLRQVIPPATAGFVIVT
jgi:hypothetical protein